MPGGPVKLTAEDIERFDRDGFLLVPGGVSADMLARAQAEAERSLNHALNVRAALGDGGRRLIARWSGDILRVKFLEPVNDISPALSALAAAPELVVPLRQLMRDEPQFAHERIVYKQTIACCAEIDRDRFEEHSALATDTFIPHTDAGWFVKDDGYPDTAINCAIHLDDSAGRGPIEFLPGSHRETYEYVMGGDVDPAVIPIERMVKVAARAGDILFFHTRIVHTSGLNDSGAPRRTFMTTFCPRSDFATDTDRRGRQRRREVQMLETRYKAAVANGDYIERNFLDAATR
jgi:ectoine hydroxylase-related dioxygenase (phytanoyl-CoA dioxygenase family)